MSGTPEEDALTIKWNTFAEWLNEQIDFAITLIEEGLLEPINQEPLLRN